MSKHLKMKCYLLAPVLLMALCLGMHSYGFSQSPEKDFFISIESANDRYYSQKQSFKRLYQRGLEEIGISLTASEMSEIHAAMRKFQFDKMPLNYTPKSDYHTLTTPSFTYTLTSNFGGVPRKVIYNNRITDPEMEAEAAPFLELYRNIWRIIYANKEVQKLQQSDVFWE